MTKSLTTLSLAALTLAGAASLNAAPMLSLGEDANLFINSSAAVRYESNVLLADDNEDGDTALVLSPGVEFVMGRPGISDNSVRALYRYHVFRYNDNGNLDTENHELRATFAVNSGKVAYKGGASYVESQTNSYTELGQEVLSARVDRAVSAFNLYAEQDLSPKTSVGMGVSGDITDYDYLGYSDYSTLSIPADLYYELTPMMDLSLGFRYRQVNISGSDSVDRDDYFYNVGVRKQLAPKLSGSVRVGVQQRKNDGDSGSETGLTASADLSYLVSPLTTVRFGLIRDYGVSPVSANSVERTSASLGANYAISPVLSAAGRLAYVMTDYYESANDRQDDFYSVGVSLNYQPTEYITVSAGYTLNTNNSDVVSESGSSPEFTNNILEVSAMFRY